MEKLSMCRVCLTEDIRLHSIVETHLQEMYESLVLMPLEAVELQEIDYPKRLSVVHNVIQLSMGHVLQMCADNVGVEALTCDDVKVEESDAEGDPSSKESNHAVQRKTEDLTSSNFDEHDFVQDMFKELNKVTAADKTAAKSTNEVTFTHTDNSKERSTSVPHSERVQYTCDTCQQCYSSKCKLERHICLCSDVWKKDLSSENSTSSHTHTGQRPHQCHVCEKSFSFMSNLTGHIRTHTGEKPYHCYICKKPFSLNSNLIKHMRTHTSEEPYHCDICKKHFSNNSNLINHMRTHTGEKLYHCEICKKQFSLKSNLTKHMRTHTGEKPYQCKECKKYCSRPSDLIKHMRTHTGEKPYHCEICKKQFSEKGTLTKHMRTHTGEKPFHCEICKKQFSGKSNLNKHMRTHTGKNLHQCNICKKYFSRASDLIRHMRTHTCEKPYECNICKKCFSARRNLTKHIRNRHTCKKHVKQSESGLALT